MAQKETIATWTKDKHFLTLKEFRELTLDGARNLMIMLVYKLLVYK